MQIVDTSVSAPHPSGKLENIPFYKKKWFLILIALLVVGGIIQGIGQELGLIEKPKADTAVSDAALPQPSASTLNSETKKEVPQSGPVKEEHADPNKTSGGITYGIAVRACNDAAQRGLFPGTKFESHEIAGKQKGQIGLSPDEFLAVYNVEVDGRKTAVTCLVDGTRDEPNVVSVKETEAR